MSTSINVALIGATGFTGEMIFDLLLGHPVFKVTYVAAKIDADTPISEIFPKYRGKTDLICHADITIAQLSSQAELVFLALPHTVSHIYVADMLNAGLRVIDLSADFRLNDPAVYTEWYQETLRSPEFLDEAVYGLPELYRDKVKNASLIANPGCYPTGIILSLAPLLAARLIDPATIIVNAITGVSGAGRKPSIALLYSEVAGDVRPYKVNNHQHTPEINQELSKVAAADVSIFFAPHLAPMDRGILSTIYVKAASEVTIESVLACFSASYADEPFVRVLAPGMYPRIHDVVGTNTCEIGVAVDTDRGMIVIMSAIDNLMKGASSQAVQNANIMFGCEETAGLKS